MTGPRFRVISIGALAAHPLRGERSAVRTGHATTTLIEAAGDDGTPVRVLVDPGLPGRALVPRLEERAGLKPDDITHVFLTSFRPDARRSIAAFERAEWLIGEAEREAVGVPLAQSLMRLNEGARPSVAAGLAEAAGVAEGDADIAGIDEDVEAVVRGDIALLQRCRAAPDRLAVGVDLFPLPGVTPGSCGLLLASRETVLICGDAVATAEHLEQGKVLPDCFDRERALESFAEAAEIADVLVPGRDNTAINPARGLGGR